MVHLADLPDQNLTRYGSIGSPTAVDRMFAPESMARQIHLEGTAVQKTERLFTLLTEQKII